MVQDSSKRATIDTRGLPNSYDPRMFYEYSVLRHANAARGLEAYLYKLMPYSVIRSFAFAIDPLSKFRTASAKITPVTRTRKRRNRTILNQTSTWSGPTRTEGWITIQNWNNIQFQSSPYMVLTSVVETNNLGTKITQAVPIDESKDTTKATRIIGSEQGEFETWESLVISTPRWYNVYNFSEIVTTGPTPAYNPQRAQTRQYATRRFDPQAAVLTTSVANGIRTSTEAITNDIMSKNILSMVKSIIPTRRDTTLFRNVAELRDIPRSIVSLQKTLLDLGKLGKSLNVQSLSKIIHDSKAVAKHIPDEYLSYHFGWKQTLKDASELLKAPDRIAKKINFLIARNGKLTTYRSTRKIPLGTVSSLNGFNYEIGNSESSVSRVHSIIRDAELRLVVSQRFDFPPADLPNLKYSKYVQQLGISPTPTDIYNLIPWTWLLDWFTGFGNYVEVIDMMNSDPSLINWGFLTCEVTGQLRTDFSSKLRTTRSSRLDGVDLYNLEIFTPLTHTSHYDFKHRKRVDVCKVIPAMKSTADLLSLTTYQQSILGALISQRTRFSR